MPSLQNHFGGGLWSMALEGGAATGGIDPGITDAPEATTEVVLEAGHCPHDEVPDQVNAALLQWLEGLKSAAAPTKPDLLAKGVN